ncbi:VOC family protein [Pararhodobacter sp.]|uniref:VOC family protein n=1 Tax=Pararhodobacter sp. TaxID=2127056 RepID=UPI002FE0CD09
MPLHPYIHFQGTCAEALAFYAEVFGAPPAKAMRYSEVPGAGFDSQRIIHAQLEIAGGTLMASDFPEGVEGDPQKAVTITATLPSVEEARARYDALMAGGDVIHPFGPSFFSEGFGMLRDRFGTHWILMKESAGLR